MIHLTETHLPEEFIFFLKENQTIEGETSAKIAYAISKFKSLEMLSVRSMKEFDKGKSSLEVIIQTLGWSNFRNRLASVFIKKQETGNYPFQTDLFSVSDLVSLEDDLVGHSLRGNPRSFFITFYLKLQALEKKVEGYKISNLSYYPQIIESIKLLKKFKVKVLEIDWLMVQLIHFCAYLSVDVIEKNIKEGSYDDLYNNFTPEQKRIYAQNLLSYGLAINDPHFIIPPAEAV